jgi:hypothetical protein
MSSFADQLMLRYLTGANIDTLLTPAADVNAQRVRSLLAAVYEPGLVAVQSVDSVRVTSTSFQVPVVELLDMTETWEKSLPQYERAVARFSWPAIAQTNWIDLALETEVRVKISQTAPRMDAVTSEDIAGLTQQAFISKFNFLDLAELMQASNATYQELQADFPPLYHLHYADPPLFDPLDPQVARTYPLRISALFFPTLDLENALVNWHRAAGHSTPLGRAPRRMKAAQCWRPAPGWESSQAAW